MDTEQAVNILRRQITEGQRLSFNGITLSKADFTSWQVSTRSYLELIYGTNSDSVKSFNTGGGVPSLPINAGEDWWEQHRREVIHAQIAKLKGLLQVQETMLELKAQPPKSKLNVGNVRVFLVHGHDDSLKNEAARFLEKLGLSVVILHEQPNIGRTLIEKFEQQADVSFALVLLTADDRGGAQTSRRLRSRARQNVIFELGYFIGRLGRSKVCALYQEDVELPSDYSGVVYIPFDQRGAWKTDVARELHAGGIKFDPARAFS